MKIEHLNYFLETISSRSINQASKKLFLNHQYLGQVLTSLETELGAKLLNRSRSGIELTPLGKKALPLIKDIVEKYDELTTLLQVTSEQNKATTILNVLMTATLQPINLLTAIDEMHEQFLNIDVTMRECEKSEILQEITEKTNTIGQLALFDDELEEIKNIQNNFDVIELKKWPTVALVRHDSPILKQYKSISLKTVMAYDIVLYATIKREQLPAYHILKESNNGKEPLIKCITSNLHVFYSMMQKDTSITIGVNRTDYLSDQEMTAIPLRDNIIITSVLIVNKSAKEDPAIQKFITLCQKAYI